MGIDTPALKHLIHCKTYGNFGKTLTIARQEVLSPNLDLFCDLTNYTHSSYCENLLKHCFGSITVDSIDNSNYENATIVYDLNKKLKNNSLGKYDTIIDCGTLEHIYNINNALYNVSKLCEVGGQIIHVLPANNFCGHGFWQLSPELFFSLYHEKNGYRDTEIFVADTYNNCTVEKLEPPSNGNRLLIDSTTPIYVCVRTVLDNEKFSHDNVQQSDYVYLWDTKK